MFGLRASFQLSEVLLVALSTQRPRLTFGAVPGPRGLEDSDSPTGLATERRETRSRKASETVPASPFV